MNDLLRLVTETVEKSEKAWCRYITANDAGQTGGHQSGFYVPKCAASLLFDDPGRKGENKEKEVRILWQGDFVTQSRMKYYGQGTRNEYRITRFGRSFPFLEDDYIGSLLILIKLDEADYAAYVLSSDEDIDDFHAYFNLNLAESNKLIESSNINPDLKLVELLDRHVLEMDAFPPTIIMSELAQRCYNEAHGIDDDDFVRKADDLILSWIDTEYNLFRKIEGRLYSEIISKPFDTVDDFVKMANEVLNRRKSRAGKSLEHHLSEIFNRNRLMFEAQAQTEGNKRPDFVFPNGDCYRNFEFPADDLVVLGAKTTCKDRWRQVLSEADRVDEKHLFTLQQGVSSAQLEEMSNANLTLVVPNAYISSFPKKYQHKLKNLTAFVQFVKEKQSHLPRFY